MVEARGEARLVQEHAPELRLDGQLQLEELENDELVETARSSQSGQVNIGGAALAELRDDTVLAVRAMFFRGESSHRRLHVHQKGSVAHTEAPARDGTTPSDARSEVT